MSRAIDTWEQVLAEDRLLERAASIDSSDVASVASLRKDYAADEVGVALELTGARTKAVTKFGERANQLVADVQGIEQASGVLVASYKSARFREVLGEGAKVTDACCGIGGDSMAMVEAGLRVTAIDRDPLRAWMAGRNCGRVGSAESVCIDIAECDLQGAALHIDPARRDESVGRRKWRLEDYQPSPEVIGQLIDAADHVAVKLSPGIDIEALPWPGELEFISEAGRLVQAVLWTGDLISCPQRATLLVDGLSHTIEGEPTPPIGEAGRYVFAIDPSVERAGLLGALCEEVGAPMLHPSLGLITTDRVLPSPWLTGFELIERMPWRSKRVAAWLAEHDGGLVEVKTRGKACDPDLEQKQLRGEGTTTYTVFVLRFDTKVEALITKRI